MPAPRPSLRSLCTPSRIASTSVSAAPIVPPWPYGTNKNQLQGLQTSRGSLVQCAGRIKNSGITWNPIEKFVSVWEIAQIRARNALLCFSNSFHSIAPKPDRTVPDPIRANRRRLYRTGLASAELDISAGPETDRSDDRSSRSRVEDRRNRRNDHSYRL
jgi:hypothetical protein